MVGCRSQAPPRLLDYWLVSEDRFSSHRFPSLNHAVACLPTAAPSAAAEVTSNGDGAGGRDGSHTTGVSASGQVQDCWREGQNPVEHIGVHPFNCAGLHPMEETVMNLAVSILLGGFSLGEANREGVCVQEVPQAEQQHTQQT